MKITHGKGNGKIPAARRGRAPIYDFKSMKVGGTLKVTGDALERRRAACAAHMYGNRNRPVHFQCDTAGDVLTITRVE